MKSVFKKRLNQSILDAGFRNQAEFAKRANIRTSTLNSYTSGVSIPSAKQLKTICVTLGVSSDYLLGITNDPFPKQSSEYGIDVRDIKWIDINEENIKKCEDYVHICGMNKKSLTLFSSIVESDLMSPEIPQGARVVFETDLMSLQPQDIVLARDIDNRLYFCRIQFSINTSSVVLYSLRYETPIEKFRDELTIIGRMIFLIKRY